MQELDLSNITIRKQIHKYFKKTTMYIYIKESLRSNFDEQYKGLYKILEILENNNEN